MGILRPGHKRPPGPFDAIRYLSRLRFWLVLIVGLGRCCGRRRRFLGSSLGGLGCWLFRSVSRLRRVAIGARLLAAARICAIGPRRTRQPVIVLGVLHQIFRIDAIAAGLGIAGQLLILLINLMRVAPNPNAGAVAIQSVRTRVVSRREPRFRDRLTFEPCLISSISQVLAVFIWSCQRK